jgi:GR25 family glycosyltransferase involved in LPS biosynthesis
VLKTVTLDREPRLVRNGHALYRLRSGHAGAASYLLTRNAAQRLYDTRQVPNAPTDDIVFPDELQRGPRPVVYQLDPAVCIQDSSSQRACDDPMLATTMLPHHVAHKRLTLKVRREFRRVWSQFRALLAVSAGHRPPFVRRIVRFDDTA